MSEASATEAKPEQSVTAALYAVRLACGVEAEMPLEPSELAKMETLCPSHEKGEKIERVTELDPVPLYAYVENYQGITSVVSLHLTLTDAQHAFKVGTGCIYGQNGTPEDEKWDDRYDGTNIHVLHFTLADSAAFFAKTLSAMDRIPGATERFGAMMGPTIDPDDRRLERNINAFGPEETTRSCEYPGCETEFVPTEKSKLPDGTYLCSEHENAGPLPSKFTPEQLDLIAQMDLPTSKRIEIKLGPIEAENFYGDAYVYEVKSEKEVCEDHGTRPTWNLENGTGIVYLCSKCIVEGYVVKDVGGAVSVWPPTPVEGA